MLSFFTCISSPIERSLSHATADVPEAFIEIGTHRSIPRSDEHPLTTTRRIAADAEAKQSKSWALQKEQHPATEQDIISRVSKRGGGGSLALQSSSNVGGFDLRTKLFQNFGMIVPVRVAARYLEQFFETVALRIETGYWADSLPTNHRVFHMWSFELSFISLHANIPWEFIQAYVLEMLDDFEKGFTGLYHEHLFGVIDGVAAGISVQLRLVGKEPRMSTR
ncbi:MAG: hypothetical protein Q9223_002081 [Gallowayella weberi]